MRTSHLSGQLVAVPNDLRWKCIEPHPWHTDTLIIRNADTHMALILYNAIAKNSRYPDSTRWPAIFFRVCTCVWQKWAENYFTREGTRSGMRVSVSTLLRGHLYQALKARLRFVQPLNTRYLYVIPSTTLDFNSDDIYCGITIYGSQYTFI